MQEGKICRLGAGAFMKQTFCGQEVACLVPSHESRSITAPRLTQYAATSPLIPSPQGNSRNPPPSSSTRLRSTRSNANTRNARSPTPPRVRSRPLYTTSSHGAETGLRAPSHRVPHHHPSKHPSRADHTAIRSETPSLQRQRRVTSPANAFSAPPRLVLVVVPPFHCDMRVVAVWPNLVPPRTRPSPHQVPFGNAPR
ncbi:hypothetical protein IMZ48_08630 [Candidatus Bathyarchaeota archaeon]|nr:hypothetical protein [Candidatus Bathyarchaeota archaeon]